MKLRNLRALDNLKLNVNLFKIFVVPQYRLATAIYKQASNEARKSLLLSLRVWLKRFCMIPINTSNKVLCSLAGNLK